jgi:CheY-like chemotaxis protein
VHLKDATRLDHSHTVSSVRTNALEQLKEKAAMDEMNNIVVVDDNPALLNVLSLILKEHGYSVRTACDGFEALSVIRGRVPDILLSDLNMPGMSGFELLSVVRRRFPTITVIAMSGAYSGRIACPGIAADGFYAKGSCSVEELLKILSEIDNKEACSSRRAAAPIWIPGLPIHQDERSTTIVACPECLRPFSHSLDDSTSWQQDSRCPHCLQSVQLAIVGRSAAMDTTTFASSIMNELAIAS